MRKIFKYPITPNSRRDELCIITVKAPKDSVPLCVMQQHELTGIWMEVDPDAPADTEYKFACVSTGHGRVPNSEEASYFGSVVVGAFVWHFYRIGS